jgi:hypothetical protein
MSGENFRSEVFAHPQIGIMGIITPYGTGPGPVYLLRRRITGDSAPSKEGSTVATEKQIVTIFRKYNAPHPLDNIVKNYQ